MTRPEPLTPLSGDHLAIFCFKNIHNIYKESLKIVIQIFRQFILYKYFYKDLYIKQQVRYLISLKMSMSSSEVC
jgi:hypothetical protein